MNDLHVADRFLGATLIPFRGGEYRIVATWLEGTQLTVLIVGDDTECFKQYLPDPQWKVKLKY